MNWLYCVVGRSGGNFGSSIMSIFDHLGYGNHYFYGIDWEYQEEEEIIDQTPFYYKNDLKPNLTTVQKMIVYKFIRALERALETATEI